jgi:hypothetical protein
VRSGAAIAFLSLFAATRLAAQIVRGTTVDAAGGPLAGAVVSLVDENQKTHASALSSDRGEYVLKADRAGRFVLRARALGYTPTISDAFDLAREQIETRRIVLATRVSLAAVRVDARTTCAVQSADALSEALAIWDQAMTSVLSASLASRSSGLTASTLAFTRLLDNTGRRIVSQQSASVHTGVVTAPWKSLPEDSLRAGRYVVTGIDGSMTFNAPGLDVLTSPNFLRDHCVRSTRSADPRLVGVAFEPNATRAKIADIHGTLWIDRASAQLTRMEYAYRNVPGFPGATPNTAGGYMEFARLRDGAAVISAWEIRLPQLETDARRTAVRVAEVAATGGQLLVARRGMDTLFTRARFQVAGTIRDSVTSRTIPGVRVALVGAGRTATADDAGRFVFADVLPGEYDVAVNSPSHDSVRASSQFRRVLAEGMEPLTLRVPTASQLARVVDRARAPSGRLRGRVLMDSSRLPIVGAQVLLPGLSLSVRSDAKGAFSLPDIPEGTHQFIVRRPGFGALDTTITVDADGDAERTVYLSRTTVLDSVSVNATRTDRALLEFEEHRRLGLGRFLTREALEKQESQRMSEVVSTLSGLGVSRGPSQGYALSKRYVVPLSAAAPCKDRSGKSSHGTVYVPTNAERAQGITCACYAQVYLDGGLMNGGLPTPPFNLNELLTSQIEAVEWYAGPSETPARYTRLNSACGVLVVHTRRPDRVRH